MHMQFKKHYSQYLTTNERVELAILRERMIFFPERETKQAYESKVRELKGKYHV